LALKTESRVVKSSAGSLGPGNDWSSEDTTVRCPLMGTTDASPLLGVRIVALSAFSAGVATQPGIVIGYGAIPSSRIDDGLRQLAASFGNRASR
jgi:hypothetical protein